MNDIRSEVRNLISANERIQSALLGGELLTKDEQELVKMVGRELLGLSQSLYTAPVHRLDGAPRGGA